jgi:hypothetical protein
VPNIIDNKKETNASKADAGILKSRNQRCFHPHQETANKMTANRFCDRFIYLFIYFIYICWRIHGGLNRLLLVQLRRKVGIDVAGPCFLPWSTEGAYWLFSCRVNAEGGMVCDLLSKPPFAVKCFEITSFRILVSQNTTVATMNWEKNRNPRG